MNSLVDYSSSSESDSEPNSHIDKKFQNVKLPPPTQLLKLKTKSVHEQPQDDPSQLDGRIRSFQHERGNWATFIYIHVNIIILDDLQTELIEIVKSKVKLKPSDDPHISLTRTVILMHHWIDSFIASIRRELSSINRFTLQLQGLKVYCNEERTRTFIGLCVNRIMSNYLQELTKRFDNVLHDYRLPEFYKEPSFHCSVLWCTGDHETVLNDNISLLNATLQSYIDEHGNDFLIDVNTIYCKTGNKLFKFDLL